MGAIGFGGLANRQTAPRADRQQDPSVQARWHSLKELLARPRGRTALAAGSGPRFGVRKKAEDPSGENAEQQGKQRKAGNSDQGQQGCGGGHGALQRLAAMLKGIGKSDTALGKPSSAGWLPTDPPGPTRTLPPPSGPGSGSVSAEFGSSPEPAALLATTLSRPVRRGRARPGRSPASASGSTSRSYQPGRPWPGW